MKEKCIVYLMFFFSVYVNTGFTFVLYLAFICCFSIDFINF